MSVQLNNEGFDTGSNYKFADKRIAPNFPRSMFDLSHLVSRDVPDAGLVFPISVFEALPASDYEISCKSLVRVMPQVVPLMSRQRLYLYAFYSRCPDLWTDFDVFIRKGYSGNEVKTVPTINADNFLRSSDIPSGFDKNPALGTSSGFMFGTHSLGDFLGLPTGVDGTVDYGIYAALPFMMYLRIWRDYFLNRNYFYNDRCILPDDDSRFRLLDNGQVASFSDVNKTIRFDVRGWLTTHVSGSGTTESPYHRVPSKGMQYLTSNLFCCGLFYHDYAADYFTSALPWPQRGNTPTLDLGDVSFSSLSGTIVPGSSTFNLFGSYSGTDITNLSVINGTGMVARPYLRAGSNSTAVDRANSEFNSWFSSKMANASVSLTGSAASAASITLENLRELSVAQTIMEKMARTDGSYREFGLTFFGEPSKAATEYRPTFIGGSYAQLLFSEVLQTSQTTSNSALGQMAGHGISADGNGYLGRFHSDDYGYIMLLGCIMPDTYYSQGLNKMWTRTSQSDWFIPERAQLGMQPIYNRELYLQQQSVVDSSGNPVNTNLWAYQDIYDEYRYQANRVGGQLADPAKKSFYPFTQSRKFTQLPNWGREFACSDDVRTDYLAASTESAYICQFDVNVRAVQPLPYRARPASILNSVS